MHLAAHRRRAYPRGAHAGNQRRAALAGADTRGPCGTSALRRGRSRLFLRCRVRTYVSRRDGEDGPGVGGPFRCGACRSRIGLAGRGAGFVRPGRRRGLHPRHGFQFVLVPRRRNRGKRTAAGLRSRRRGQRRDVRAQPRERHLQRAYFPARRVSRGARTDLRGDHPPGLPGTLRQPFSGIVRAVCPCASGPPRYQGHGREELRRFRRAQPERLSRPSARGVCGRRCGRFRGFAARNADALRPRGGDDRPLSGGRIDRISLWKTE